jgi:site-specific DNA-methyltransferase (adenine-specific)
MEYMKTLPDKAFDLAIVDPPYGLGASNKNFIRQGKQTGKSLAVSGTRYTAKDWDSNTPDGRYFDQLFRVSKNQIIWGWNYFVQYLNTCPSYIVWNKDNGENLYADCESAWCIIPGAARVFKYKWHGMLQEKMGVKKEERIHPTQKPVALYAWLLENYAETGWKIFDTHLGSGSIAIACEKKGFELTACEIDEEYYNNALARVKKDCDLGLFQTPPSSGEGSVGKKNLLF